MGGGGMQELHALGGKIPFLLEQDKLILPVAI